MKRILFILSLMFVTLGIMAQRAAVMEFKAGAGISQADVDGISGIFITYFRPAGYTMVERTQIDRVIEEQGFQRSRLTESQMVRIGEILNVSKIVIGDVNIVMGQYNVDVRVINVESGTYYATEGATFSGISYRETMKSIAQKLASKIAITAGPRVTDNSGSSSTNVAKTRAKVETVYGYLHVFPNELGYFQSVPTSIISNINNQQMHGYNTWRIPTNEELSLLRGNGYTKDSQYMTTENKAGVVLLVTTGKSVDAKQAEMKSQGFVDLGLPSGNYWKSTCEDGYYTYNEAVSRFGSNLPSKVQFEELKTKCRWTSYNGGYKVTGPNGNYITLFANGYYQCRGILHAYGHYGYYWTSTKEDDDCYYLGFAEGDIYFNDNLSCARKSVVLISK